MASTTPSSNERTDLEGTYIRSNNLHGENGHCASAFTTQKKKQTNKQGTSIMYRKKNHILWVMCSESYTAEALVPANALTAKNKVKRKQKVYGSSEFWSAQTARRGKVDVLLLDRYSRNHFSTVPVYTPP